MNGTYSIDVVVEAEGFTLRLIRSGGSILMQRTFLSRNEAEDERDALAEAWLLPLEIHPTKTIEQ